MKTKIFKQVFFLLLIAAILYSCMAEEALIPTKIENGSPEVMEAKKWYDSQEKSDGISLISPHDGYKEDTLFPDWSMAFSNEDKEYKITEVRLLGKQVMKKQVNKTGDELLEFGKRFSVTCHECGEKYEATGDKRYLAFNIRLILRQHKESGVRDGCVMLTVPDLSYLENHLDHPFQSIILTRK